MREIKFRAKRIDNGEWIYGNYVKAECLNSKGKYEHFIIEVNANGQTYLVDENTICQFTNHYDKNGKEIYELDLIKDKKFNNVFKVIYEDCSFKLKSKHIDSGISQEMINWIEANVIGNIFDNPELLGEQQ